MKLKNSQKHTQGSLFYLIGSSKLKIPFKNCRVQKNPSHMNYEEKKLI